MEPRKCVLCGQILSIYNSTDQCFKHSVTKEREEKEVNEDAMKVFTSRPQPLLHEECWWKE